MAEADLGCRAVGIEIDERYCELAVARLGQGSFDFDPAASSVGVFGGNPKEKEQR